MNVQFDLGGIWHNRRPNRSVPPVDFTRRNMFAIDFILFILSGCFMATFLQNILVVPYADDETCEDHFFCQHTGRVSSGLVGSFL
jgi:hypothetical protein